MSDEQTDRLLRDTIYKLLGITTPSEVAAWIVEARAECARLTIENKRLHEGCDDASAELVRLRAALTEREGELARENRRYDQLLADKDEIYVRWQTAAIDRDEALEANAALRQRVAEGEADTARRILDELIGEVGSLYWGPFGVREFITKWRDSRFVPDDTARGPRTAGDK